jgi:hypothetical protein
VCQKSIWGDDLGLKNEPLHDMFRIFFDLSPKVMHFEKVMFTKFIDIGELKAILETAFGCDWATCCFDLKAKQN